MHREAFDVYCPRCGHEAGMVIVTIDVDGRGTNKPERKLAKRCECGEAYARREA